MLNILRIEYDAFIKSLQISLISLKNSYYLFETTEMQNSKYPPRIHIFPSSVNRLPTLAFSVREQLPPPLVGLVMQGKVSPKSISKEQQGTDLCAKSLRVLGTTSL